MSADVRRWDRRIRQILIPVFGLTIPNVTGLYGPLGPSSPWYWLGTGLFLGLSVLIWLGNLRLWLHGRSWTDWISQPRKRLALLASTSLFYTAPLSVAVLWAWYRLVGWPANWPVIWRATILCVLVDLFVKNTYETVYLVRQRSRDMLAVEQLEKAKLQAQLAALRTQVDPHFIFNCLNTLAGLAEETPDRATDFAVALADVYRYLLRIRDKELVPLAEELEFLAKYCSLLAIRFEDAIGVSVTGHAPEGAAIPPTALQTLVENAVKHNRFNRSEPLRVQVIVDRSHVVVENNKRLLHEPASSSGVGLRNLDERCRLSMNRRLEIDSANNRFVVRVPLSQN